MRTRLPIPFPLLKHSSLSPSPSHPPILPTTPTCPAPTCPCAPTPSFPPTHPIDHTAPLKGVVAAYAAHVLVCTGVDDWASRIEAENGGENGAARVKSLYGPRGTMTDMMHHISVLNSSFKPTPSPSSEEREITTSAYILPSFAYFPIFPPNPAPRLPLLSPSPAVVEGAIPLRDIMVLICGHGGRDLRCGVMGPLLQGEFEEKLAAAGLAIRRSPPCRAVADEDVGVEGEGDGDGVVGARVGLVSHIGGHKFAGNVIVYIPPDMRTCASAEQEGGGEGAAKHTLAGMGIWYGRVEPRHVEGIVRETVLGGRVVEELFRGGIDAQRRMLRL